MSVINLTINEFGSTQIELFKEKTMVRVIFDATDVFENGLFEKLHN